MPWAQEGNSLPEPRAFQGLANKILPSLFLGIFLTSICGYLLLHASFHRIWGWLWLGAFLFVLRLTVIVLLSIGTGRFQMIVNSEGFQITAPNRDFFAPWAAIEKIYIYVSVQMGRGGQKSHLLCVKIDDEKQGLCRGLGFRLGGLGFWLKGRRLVYSVSADIWDVDAVEVMDVIDGWKASASRTL